MESEIPMFCFQCEQTAGGKGCTGKAGVCGKTREVADLQDRLTGALVSLASSKGCDTLGPDGDLAVMKALFATLTNVDFDADDIAAQTSRIRGMSGGAAPYDMASVWNAQEDVRSLKSLILFGIRGMAAYAYHAAVLGRTDASVMETVYRGLRAIGSDVGADELLAMVMEVGRSNLVCMEMLDSANREAFGIPAPVKVSTDIEAGPAIIVTGHDLRDLKALLEQTEGRGINVYTHGEMLPAHAYPELSKYGHLKGHYGTAWQNQKAEFDGIDVPVLFTTNCLMPPKDSYIGNVFTSGPVCHPGTVHIDGEDFPFGKIKELFPFGGIDPDAGIPFRSVGPEHETVAFPLDFRLVAGFVLVFRIIQRHACFRFGGFCLSSRFHARKNGQDGHCRQDGCELQELHVFSLLFYDCDMAMIELRSIRRTGILIC